MDAKYMQMRDAAIAFLSVANELNARVTAYINGSYDENDILAYHTVKDAEAKFLRLHNDYFNENVKPTLNYELAESII